MGRRQRFTRPERLSWGGARRLQTLEAGCRFGVPVSGTMAHSWVMAHRDELTAFRRYMDIYGRRSVLLVDTYDCRAAVRLIGESGLRPAGVRLGQWGPCRSQP